ncbi:hypothetical protein [Microterricola viridarii]|uniref:hypothetical protein n=1 Tax=Microterricola viridarii TaxID=412690 RepID=UPI0013652A61|nr:hypothetical protein [Microterricola viridarii]
MANHFPATADGLVLSREAESVGLHAPLSLYRARVLAVGHQRRTPVLAGFSATVL